MEQTTVQYMVIIIIITITTNTNSTTTTITILLSRKEEGRGELSVAGREWRLEITSAQFLQIN